MDIQFFADLSTILPQTTWHVIMSFLCIRNCGIVWHRSHGASYEEFPDGKYKGLWRTVYSCGVKGCLKDTVANNPIVNFPFRHQEFQCSVERVISFVNICANLCTVLPDNWIAFNPSVEDYSMAVLRLEVSNVNTNALLLSWEDEDDYTMTITISDVFSVKPSCTNWELLERFATAVFEAQQANFHTPANVLIVVQNNPDSVLAFCSTYYHHAIVNSCRFTKITSKALQDDIGDIGNSGAQE